MTAVGAAADITTTTTTTATTNATTAETKAKMMIIIITKTIIIKNKKDKICILIDVAVPTNRNMTQKEAEKETKIQGCMYSGTMNVEHEMYDHTSNKRSHRNSNII